MPVLLVELIHWLHYLLRLILLLSERIKNSTVILVFCHVLYQTLGAKIP